MPMLNMRFVLPDHIIDLNKIKGCSISARRNGALVVGAMTRQRDLEFSDAVKARRPIIHEALLNVGHRQTRNRGTVGGSLCHLDPSAEIPTLATGSTRPSPPPVRTASARFRSRSSPSPT